MRKNFAICGLGLAIIAVSSANAADLYLKPGESKTLTPNEAMTVFCVKETVRVSAVGESGGPSGWTNVNGTPQQAYEEAKENLFYKCRSPLTLDLDSIQTVSSKCEMGPSGHGQALYCKVMLTGLCK